ncbi:MAG TPA: FAD-dependent oxidoreductase [Gemmatimonadaceae bacterium]|nr:FAD-dependent oxidoreductase [Gemmatimonadaceae bacterium]
MGGSETTLAGPDLTAGIRAADLLDGTTILGHARGEPVLLAKVAGEVFAIGAACAHYGGPLAEGALVGDTVRCPWHHACFSVRTGEALRAPALNPVARWRVEFRGETLCVVEKIERDPLAPAAPPPPRRSRVPTNVVIVGAGAAGIAAAEMLRRSGFGGAVTIVDPDGDAPYDRPNLSKDYLAGNAPEEWIPIRPAEAYAAHDITFIRNAVSAIDTHARRVDLEHGGPRLRYDALVLATGAEPVRLRIPGSTLPHVHVLRTLADSRAIIDRAKFVSRAVVIGASFIGLEVAAALRARAIGVTVVAPEDLPLERVMGPAVGAAVKALHERHGVVFRLGQTAREITPGEVVLADGERVPGELVVVGIGVRPRLALAEQAGLALDRGVVVNEYLETSDPRIWAAGDIARWPDARAGTSIRVEHWVVAERMGQTAARNILGAREPFRAVPFFWSAHYDMSINYVGHAERWDRIDVEGSAERLDLSARFVHGDRTLAVATIFRDQESLAAELAMEASP